MFLRRFQRRKNGKDHVYWALVESYRTARGSRQRIVSYLGELQESEQSGWAQLSRKLNGQPTSQRTFFDPPAAEDACDDELVLVHLKGIRLERLRDFGDVWLALGLWRMLGVDRLLQDHIREGREEIPWSVVAAILVIARFCEPSSELHIETTWYRNTALTDLLGVAPEKVHTDRLYAGLDELLPHKESIEKHLIEQNWSQVEEGVEVKLVASPDGEERYIVARSAERREKEKAMHERFIGRMENGLKKLQAAMKSGRLKDETLAHRRLGRLQGQNSRAAKAFDVTIERLPKPVDKAHLRIHWTRNKAWTDWATLSEGCYLLRSNLTHMDAATLWKHYIQLTEAEWAFRITKDELVLRPIWHHKEDRVKAHILVCFLAYVLWKTLAGWMHKSGLGDAPRSVLNELTKIKSGDVVLPAQNADGSSPRVIRLRCVTEPDAEQKLLLHRLGLTLPKRLRSTVDATQM